MLQIKKSSGCSENVFALISTLSLSIIERYIRRVFPNFPNPGSGRIFHLLSTGSRASWRAGENRDRTSWFPSPGWNACPVFPPHSSSSVWYRDVSGCLAWIGRTWSGSYRGARERRWRIATWRRRNPRCWGSPAHRSTTTPPLVD